MRIHATKLFCSLLAFGLGGTACDDGPAQRQLEMRTAALSSGANYVWFGAKGPVDERGAEGDIMQLEWNAPSTASVVMNLVEGRNYLEAVAWQYDWQQNGAWYRETDWGSASIDVGAGKKGNGVTIQTSPSGSGAMFVSKFVLSSTFDPSIEGCVDSAYGEVLVYAQPNAQVELFASNNNSLRLVPGDFEDNCDLPGTWLVSTTVTADAYGVVRARFAVVPDAPSGFPALGAIGAQSSSLFTRVRVAREFRAEVDAE